jgi:hypothetical protein
LHHRSPGKVPTTTRMLTPSHPGHLQGLEPCCPEKPDQPKIKRETSDFFQIRRIKPAKQRWLFILRPPGSVPEERDQSYSEWPPRLLLPATAANPFATRTSPNKTSAFKDAGEPSEVCFPSVSKSKAVLDIKGKIPHLAPSALTSLKYS